MDIGEKNLVRDRKYQHQLYRESVEEDLLLETISNELWDNCNEKFTIHTDDLECCPLCCQVAFLAS